MSFLFGFQYIYVAQVKIKELEENSPMGSKIQWFLRTCFSRRIVFKFRKLQRRYADYENTPQQWILIQLLQKYFVPLEREPSTKSLFSRDAQSHRACEIMGERAK